MNRWLRVFCVTDGRFVHKCDYVQISLTPVALGLVVARLHVLTHHPVDKMAAILADDNFKCIFLNENDSIPIRISPKFVPKSPVDNKSTLVQVMAWRRSGDKPLPERMLAQFTDAYARH